MGPLLGRGGALIHGGGAFTGHFSSEGAERTAPMSCINALAGGGGGGGSAFWRTLKSPGGSMLLWTAGGCSTSSEGWTAGGQVTERRRHIPIPMPLALAARRKLASGKLGACPLPTHHPLEAHVMEIMVPTTATPTRVAMIMVTSRAIRDNRK